MKRTSVSACAAVVAASLAGCMATGDVEYAGEVRVTSPELVQISPGVMVLADADEPIFYSRGHYWLYRDGYWFRSDAYRSGYVRVEFTYVPTEIRVIDRPQLYVQYRRHMGRERQARPPQTRMRSPQPMPPQPPPRPQPMPQRQPTVPPPSPTYPHDPYESSRPTPPYQPGTQPTQPTTPPPVTAPTSPGQSGTAPGQHPHEPSDRPSDQGTGMHEHEHSPPQDTSDRATPPGQGHTDDRTKKQDEKKGKKKNEKQ